MNTDILCLGARELRRWRATARISQAELAELIDSDRMQVSKIECGHVRPGGELAVRLEAVTGIPVRYWYPEQLERVRRVQLERARRVA